MTRLTRRNPAPKPGIVHLGPGAFFRAFNATYTQDALDAAGGEWGIVAVSLRSATARDQLAPQGGAFTAVTLSPDGTEARVIEAITETLVAAEDIEAVLTAMADPGIRIVSLTITEKGYCHASASGRLALDHPDIVHDLAHPYTPRSAPGVLVAALARRHAAGHRPFTVLSCDNLPDNGALARQVTCALAQAQDPALAQWIADQGRFPSTMVDRITPATTEADLARLTETEGYTDHAAVWHEPFRQCVIEDDFVDEARPAWPATYVTEVAPFEAMKLRCLNGTHSALAYLGYLAGHETIAAATADPAFTAYLERLWTAEILPTVPPPPETDLTAYTEALLRRYQNPAIRHRTWQIAMDGSQKLPQRLLGTLSDQLDRDGPIDGLALAVAAWMRYVSGSDDQGQPIDVRDPLADRLHAAATQGPAALLAITDIFPPALASHPRARSAILAAHAALTAHGVMATLRDGV